ncbi:intraflagellar transport protein 22 homolog [Penaeus monodon]|uniref:intraflagellar transport protein 22 homolog n=1 Tax=Penaeus monodon TaxID=6687 RepID=UPI0018A7215E|nr:intraflagellar transport protein 22 homolog isoform X1 [Penaeus monodon]XP_037774443.1 intraflagellar transport protein 22 homolog [Penaeus monodon]
MSNKVKIVMVGPPECGKTTLTNFLSEAGEVGSGEYRPTKGCRILEFEVPNVTYNNTAASVEVELWDVSGDRTYETCWPVIQQGAQGIIFVYSPGREEHARVLDNLYTHFAEQQAVSEAQCVVFCHYKPGARGKGAKLSTPFNKISKIDTHLDDDSGSVKRDFNDFIASVMGHMSDVVERQENFILQ